MKSAATACIFALGLVLGGAATAHGGEDNGKGEPVPGGVYGKSACSFSGRDVPDAHEGPRNMPDDGLTALRNYTQSFGLFVSLGIKDTLPPFLHPGIACRGNAPHEE